MVSPRIVFIEILRLGVDQQRGVKGGLVNEHISVDSTVGSLPRAMNDTRTLQIEFMRRLEYRTPMYHETVRTKCIMDAAKYLVTTPLYAKHGIILKETALPLSEENLDFIADERNSLLFRKIAPYSPLPKKKLI